jgi:hypothetical protein
MFRVIIIGKNLIRVNTSRGAKETQSHSLMSRCTKLGDLENKERFGAGTKAYSHRAPTLERVVTVDRVLQPA